MTVLQRRFSTAVQTPHWRPRRRLQRLLDQAGPLLRRLQEKEESMGLMRYGPRVVMSIALR